MAQIMIKFEKDDIKTTKVGYNFLISGDKNIDLIFTPEAIEELINDYNEINKNKQIEKQISNTPIDTNNTFKRTWKNAKTEPPEEIGRYWCLIEEQNDLGKSYFQWNCSYHVIEKRWSDNHENFNVIYWTELLPMPF